MLCSVIMDLACSISQTPEILPHFSAAERGARSLMQLEIRIYGISTLYCLFGNGP